MIAWSKSWAGHYIMVYFDPPHSSYPIKNQIGCHFIKMLFFLGLHNKRKHFTLFKGIIMIAC